MFYLLKNKHKCFLLHRNTVIMEAQKRALSPDKVEKAKEAINYLSALSLPSTSNVASDSDDCPELGHSSNSCKYLAR